MRTSQKTLAVVAILIALCALAVVMVSAAPAAPNAVTVTKTVDPKIIKPDCANCVLTYTIVLTTNETSVSGVLTDVLPVYLSFDRWLQEPAGAGRTGDVITWTGTIASGTPVELAFTVKLPDYQTLQGVVATGQIVNTACFGRLDGTAILPPEVCGSATTVFYRYIFLPLVMRNFAG
ncbi:MAG TPA: hypothetical protein PLJ78_14000 [Anaerolineae bacterium]|mgnify:CR=1 FL=1|nr:hypothetical protein [Anaerolineae bacterium]HQK15044.1 hypothetical protein [Anaerolineae bacterium]